MLLSSQLVNLLNRLKTTTGLFKTVDLQFVKLSNLKPGSQAQGLETDYAREINGVVTAHPAHYPEKAHFVPLSSQLTHLS